MISKIIAINGNVNCFGFSILNRFQANLTVHFRGGPVEINRLYTPLIEDLLNLINQKYLYLTSLGLKSMKMKLLKQVSNLLVSLEKDSQNWAILQFKHLARFPEMKCDVCDVGICFSCGTIPYHDNLTCQEHMKIILQNQQGTKEALDTIGWKLKNSKMCPNCSVMINRDEGCNKVDCALCGHQFCWHCLSGFDGGSCSFYRCQLVGNSDQKENAKTELGVPNIINIQARQIHLAH